MMKTSSRSAACRQIVLTILSVFAISLLADASAEALSRDERIAQARRDWLVGLATEKRIAEELARYKSSEQASPDVVELYETYLDRVRRLTEEKRKRLEALEGRRMTGSTPAPPSGFKTKAPHQPAYDPQIPEDQELDEIQALNTELDRSLAAFDDMLLREIEQSRVQSEVKMQKLAREAARAAKSLRGAQGKMEGSAESEQGLKEGQSSDGGGNETGKMDGDRQGQQEAAGTTGEREAEASQQASGQGTDMARDQNRQAKGTASGETGPPGEGDNINTQDDDIVARQLREAAENETDPELKEKLWKEYRDYKKSI